MQVFDHKSSRPSGWFVATILFVVLVAGGVAGFGIGKSMPNATGTSVAATASQTERPTLEELFVEATRGVDVNDLVGRRPYAGGLVYHQEGGITLKFERFSLRSDDGLEQDTRACVPAEYMGDGKWYLDALDKTGNLVQLRVEATDHPSLLPDRPGKKKGK